MIISSLNYDVVYHVFNSSRVIDTSPSELHRASFHFSHSHKRWWRHLRNYNFKGGRVRTPAARISSSHYVVVGVARLKVPDVSYIIRSGLLVP